LAKLDIKKQKMKCFLCNKKAIGKLSPDMDLEGLGFCKEHKYEMMIHYMGLFSENDYERKEAEKFLRNKMNKETILNKNEKKCIRKISKNKEEFIKILQDEYRNNFK